VFNQKKYSIIYWLVVSTYPSEKYEFVSWDDDIPNIWKHKIPWFQSPPTRIDIFGAEGETWTSFYGRCCVYRINDGPSEAGPAGLRDSTECLKW
jgi:hypothetical protein